MVSRISELVIDCRDPQRLADFWCEVLGYVVLDVEDDGAIEIGPPRRLRRTAADADPEPQHRSRTGKLPLHIDVNPTDRDQDAELERLLAIGARPADVGQTGEESLALPRDPEGNEFCLLKTRLSRVPPGDRTT